MAEGAMAVLHSAVCHKMKCLLNGGFPVKGAS